MRAARLHPLGGDVPLGFVEIELRPLRAQHLGLAAHAVDQQARRRGGSRVRALAPQSAPERAQFRFAEVPVVLSLGDGDDAAQRNCRIALYKQLLDGVVVDLLNDDPYALRGVWRGAPGLDDLQHVGRLHVLQGLAPDGRPNEALQSRLYLAAVPLGLGGQALIDPLEGERLEQALVLLQRFLRLALCLVLAPVLRRIGALLDHRPVLGVPVARIGHTDFGITADQHRSALAREHVLVAPGLRAAWVHQHEQAAAVRELVGLHLRLRVVDPGRRQLVVEMAHGDDPQK